MFPESVVPEAGWPAGVTLAVGDGVVVNFQGGQQAGYNRDPSTQGDKRTYFRSNTAEKGPFKYDGAYIFSIILLFVLVKASITKHSQNAPKIIQKHKRSD